MSNDERKTTLASTYPLPKPPANFTGRAQALEWLRHNLHPGRVLTIHGPGGLGKTAVTNHCLHQLFAEGELQKRFPQGLIFHTFYHQPRLEQAYLTILEGVGLEPPNQLEAMERLVRHVLQSQRLVLVLDGAEEAVDLEGLLKLQGQAGVLISSRKREDVYGEGHELERFPNEEAVQLLQKIAGRYAEPRPAAQELCALVANLPLAVQLVGRFLYMRQETAAEYVTWLKNAPLRQVHLKTGRENSLPLFYQRTFDQLVPEMQAVLNLFRYLAFAPVPLPALQAALGVEERPLKNWVNELINYSLLERLENGRVQPIHALIYQWVRESGPVEPEKLTRLLEYWEKQGLEAEEKGAEGFAPLHGLAPHWEELVQVAIQAQLYQEADDLIEGVDWYLYLQSHSAEHLRFRHLSLKVGQHLNTPRDLAYAIYRLGKIHHRCAEYRLARERYEEARPIYAQIGDRLGEANCIQALGDVHLQVAEYGLARERYEEARPIYAQIGARLGEANCIKALGDVHRMVAEYGLARERYEEARPIYAQIGGRLGEANCIKALGDVHYMLDEYGLARERYEEARPIYAQIGARLGEAHCIKALGQVHLRVAEYGLARERYEEARLIYAQSGDRLGEAHCIKALGDVHLQGAEYGLARERVEEARPIYAQSGDRLGEADCIKTLGDVHLRVAEYGLARERYEEARPLYAQSGDRLGEAICIKALGDVHLQGAEYGLARERYEEAQGLFAQIESRVWKAICIKALGDVHLQVAEYGLARERYEEAWPIFAQSGFRLGEAECIKSLGDVHLKVDEYGLARERYEGARLIHAQIGARLGEAHCIKMLGVLYQMQDELELAKQYHEQAFALFQDIGSPDDIASSKFLLGFLALQLGDEESGLNLIQMAIVDYEKFAPHKAQEFKKLLEQLLTDE